MAPLWLNPFEKRFSVLSYPSDLDLKTSSIRTPQWILLDPPLHRTERTRSYYSYYGKQWKTMENDGKRNVLLRFRPWVDSLRARQLRRAFLVLPLSTRI